MSQGTLDLRRQLFIDGKFVDAASGETFATVNPATGAVLTPVAAASDRDVDDAVRAARRAFDSGCWSALAPRQRRRVLLDFADRVEANAAELAALDCMDAGKPITECMQGDVPSVSRSLRWYAECLDKMYGRTAPTGPNQLAVIARQPVGVVGAVVPWNYPASTAAGKIAPALAAGNSVVLKPAELAPLSALRLGELAAEAGLPDGVLNVVPGYGEVAGRAVGLHPDIDVVSFTGSTEVGREFLRYSASSNLKNIALECGGKSPQLVLGDVDAEIESVASELVRAAMLNMGENCTCGSLILVHRSLFDDLLQAMLTQLPAWPVGDPFDPATRIGPLISAEHLEKVLGYIHGAEQAGATVVAGGSRLLAETGGWYLGPTILSDVTSEMAIFNEEVFGPVTAVVGFDDPGEAVALANSTPYGLAASLYTRDMRFAHQISAGLNVGTVSVNCYSEGDISTPFGGWKASGFGARDKGMEAFDQYSELKTIWYSME